MQVLFVKFYDAINVKDPECYIIPLSAYLKGLYITPDPFTFHYCFY